MLGGAHLPLLERVVSTQAIQPPRPALDLDCLRRQIAAITEHLRVNVWEKKK